MNTQSTNLNQPAPFGGQPFNIWHLAHFADTNLTRSILAFTDARTARANQPTTNLMKHKHRTASILAAIEYLIRKQQLKPEEVQKLIIKTIQDETDNQRNLWNRHDTRHHRNLCHSIHHGGIINTIDQWKRNKMNQSKWSKWPHLSQWAWRF